MSFKIILEEKAIKEIKEAEDWYFKKSIIAAENFQKEVVQAIVSLKSDEINHRKIFQDIRQISLKIFPYNIYYNRKEVEQIVQIIAVLHNKRDASYVVGRLFE